MEFPGEKLLAALWDTLANKGIGGLLAPFQTRRVGKAQIDVKVMERLALAQVDRQIEQLKTLPIQGCPPSTPLLPEFGVAPGDPPLGTPLHLVHVGEAVLRDQVRKEVNIAEAVLAAERRLAEDDSEPSSKSISDDWLYRWRDEASNVAEEKMRDLWGALLAGELKTPGTFGLRTLDFLRNLTSEEAELIERLAPFQIDNWIWTAQEDMLVAANLNLEQRLRLEELGVLANVTGELETTWTIPTGAPALALKGKTHALIARSESGLKSFGIPVVTVTKIGQEVIKLCGANSNEAFFRALGLHMKGLGLVVQLSRSYSQTPEGVWRFTQVEVL